MKTRAITLASRAKHCPLSSGVYRLYAGRRLLHVGMAAGGATLRSEVIAHALGHYGRQTQGADRVQWEVAPDGFFAYRRFLSICAAAAYAAWGPGLRAVAAPSRSRQHSQPLRRARVAQPRLRARPPRPTSAAAV